MSGTFPKFPEIQQASEEAWCVQPGQTARVRDESDETIRARNAAASPIRPWPEIGQQEI